MCSVLCTEAWVRLETATIFPFGKTERSGKKSFSQTASPQFRGRVVVEGGQSVQKLLPRRPTYANNRRDRQTDRDRDRQTQTDRQTDRQTVRQRQRQRYERQRQSDTHR